MAASVMNYNVFCLRISTTSRTQPARKRQRLRPNEWRGPEMFHLLRVAARADSTQVQPLPVQRVRRAAPETIQQEVSTVSPMDQRSPAHQRLDGPGALGPHPAQVSRRPRCSRSNSRRPQAGIGSAPSRETRGNPPTSTQWLLSSQ